MAILCVILIPAAVMSNQAQPVEQPPADIVSCEPQGNNIVCTLLGEGVILVVPIPTVKVPGPTIKLPGPTIIVPGATVTLPGLPGVTVTVSNPGVTRTITVNPNPGPSRLSTKTVIISAAPGGGQTTTTVEPTGQVGPTGGTIEPSPSEGPTQTPDEPGIITKTVVQRVGVGLLVILGMAAAGMLALFLGYKFGFDDGSNASLEDERKWIRDILNRGNK